MQLKQLKDRQLLSATKSLVEKEREVLTAVLQHLREIDRRRLYSDLGYQSLFDYAVNELKYSENQAVHRLNAMRLIKELPRVEQSIARGELSLSNASQAQRAFRQVAKLQTRSMSKVEKANVINSLKNKSTREGQKTLLELLPNSVNHHAFERERQVTPTTCEVRFLMDDSLKEQLEEVRSLLGTKAIKMGYAELIAEMARLSVQKLSENKFGKKRTCGTGDLVKQASPKSTVTPQQSQNVQTKSACSKNKRYVSKALYYQVWKRDGGKCRQCKSRRNLNVDHIKPIALGGETVIENLRLLCFGCNQRHAIKSFGSRLMEPFRRSS